MSDQLLQIQSLIDNLHEGLSVEVKNWLNGLLSKEDKSTLAKEIIALANNGGGFIFIGFDDAEPHKSIEPNGLEAGFTQDGIADLVERYLSPPCQCTVQIITRTGESVLHPVIVVPGEHRTPVFARRSSPNGKDLKTGTVYIRRPGGKSEPARTQDDWEKLLDRLVKARQSDQLDAIRQIFEPTKIDAQSTPDTTLLAWITDSISRWNTYTNQLPADDKRRFLRGYWHVGFKITGFHADTLVELQEFLDRSTPKHSGWPPFTVLHREDRAPKPMGDFIEAWLGKNDEGEHSDYWRVSKDGFGFLLRPMQEDREGFGSNVSPGPPIPVMDWILPIWRVTEVFQHLRSLASEYAEENSSFEMSITYERTKGRTLWHFSSDGWFDECGPVNMDSLTNSVSGSIGELDLNLKEYVWRLLAPIYEQFNFAKLERPVVSRIVDNVLNSKSR